jgi:cation transport regulator
VQAHLPSHAQDVYREAFNHPFAAHFGELRQEEAAHRIAWAAVKRSYVKIGGSWVGRALARKWRKTQKGTWLIFSAPRTGAYGLLSNTRRH